MIYVNVMYQFYLRQIWILIEWVGNIGGGDTTHIICFIRKIDILNIYEIIAL